ncbi:MAG: SDR family oxidoreductase [Acidobacteriota bacterium]
MAENGSPVVVTGAGRGIGRGIAVRLAQDGFDVVVNYRADAEGAEATAEAVRAAGRRALVVQADVGSRADVERLFDTVLEQWGPPYGLVNNAGIQSWKPLLELSDEEWEATLRTNLTGAFLCTRRAAREMAGVGKGRIVNIGAGCNKGPFPRLAAYTASKGGLELFTRVAAVELGPLGITVNCVAPGAVEVERTRREAPSYVATWSAITPLRRIGKPEDVAAAVAFLLSDDASFVNGQTLYVDGGLFTQLPWPYEQ